MLENWVSFHPFVLLKYLIFAVYPFHCSLGIAVCNIPSYGVEEVADSTICNILNLYRKTFELATKVKEGAKFLSIENIKNAAQGSVRVRGSILGLIGLG